MNVKSEITT